VEIVLTLVLSEHILVEVRPFEQLAVVSLRLLLHVHVRLHALLVQHGLLRDFYAVVVVGGQVVILFVQAAKHVATGSPFLELCYTPVESPHEHVLLLSLGDEVARLTSQVDSDITSFVNQVGDALRRLPEINDCLGTHDVCQVGGLVIAVVKGEAVLVSAAAHTLNEAWSWLRTLKFDATVPAESLVLVGDAFAHNFEVLLAFDHHIRAVVDALVAKLELAVEHVVVTILEVAVR